MKNSINHIGTVQCIEGNHVQVRILQSSACASCEAHKLCQSSEHKEKLIDVYTKEAGNFSVGQQVNVEASLTMGMQAALLAYVLPLIILVVVLALTVHFTHNDIIGSAAGLGSLIPYYISLYLMRNRISKKISFKIK